MRAFVRALGLTAAYAAAYAGPAAAQLEPRPATSPAERQLIETERALAIQQRQRALSQQSQFEINALRDQLQREQLFPPPGRGCPTGAAGC